MTAAKTCHTNKNTITVDHVKCLFCFVLCFLCLCVVITYNSVENAFDIDRRATSLNEIIGVLELRINTNTSTHFIDHLILTNTFFQKKNKRMNLNPFLINTQTKENRTKMN